MIIEFVGADGSGKTTTIQTLRRHMNERGSAFAYERSFQSNSVRLMEIAASLSSRARPDTAFTKECIEAARTLDLVTWSASLTPFLGGEYQVLCCDGYIVEQASRLIGAELWTPSFRRLLDLVTKPDKRIYLKLSPETAINRMRSRPKGDALLLASDPLHKTVELISSLERALADLDADFLTIDAEQPAAEVVQQVVDYLDF